jgi:SAM-dependent methyltransferase
MEITHNKHCRICKSENLEKFLDLGPVALVSNFIPADKLDIKEQIPNLDIYVCKDCWLAQVVDVPDPEELFLNDYPYMTRFISTMVTHFEARAKESIDRFNLQDDDLVMDIGSNDGVYLGGFKKHKPNINVLGVDPAPNIVPFAEERGVRSANIFFTEENAKKLREKEGPAKLILSTNTFAHIDDLDDFVKGLKIMLDDDGVFIFENPYAIDTILGTQFDTMYYDHVSYYAIHPCKVLFERFGMEIFDVKQTDVHGGSIMVYVKKKESSIPVTSKPAEMLAKEKELGFNTMKPYLEFAERVARFKENLMDIITALKAQGKTIAAYGASARGNVTLSYCGLNNTILDYICDKSDFKQGRHTPGTRLEIFAPSKLAETMPDYTLMVAWNFTDEILKEQEEYRKKGGRFIVPLPELKIV